MCLVAGASRADRSDSSSSRQVARLSVRERTRAGECTLMLAGELDLASRPLLDKAVRCVERRDTVALVLDLSELAFIDSTGLHGVFAAKALCAEHGCAFALVRGPSQVQRLFELSGVIDELPFRGEPAAANLDQRGTSGRAKAV